MSHMVYRDHIAITSGDKSTTRRKVFCFVLLQAHRILSLSVSVAILRVALWQIRKYCDRSRQVPECGRTRPTHHETGIAVSRLTAYSYPS